MNCTRRARVGGWFHTLVRAKLVADIRLELGRDSSGFAALVRSISPFGFGMTVTDDRTLVPRTSRHVSGHE